jgi:hypothetical protein
LEIIWCIKALKVIYFLINSPFINIDKPSDVTTQVSNCNMHLEDVLQIMKSKRKIDEGLPVIIIDNINKLAENQPEALMILQESAKEWIDSNLALIIFVTSEGKSESLMNGIFKY